MLKYSAWNGPAASASRPVKLLRPIRLIIADPLDHLDLSQPGAIFTLDLKGINRLSDVEISINGTLLQWNGYHYNHYDHGCWNDIVQFDVPASALRSGKNTIELRRIRENPEFEGTIEVRKCILDLGGHSRPGDGP